DMHYNMDIMLTKQIIHSTPCEVQHDAGPEQGDERHVGTDARDRGASQEGDGEKDRVRRRRAYTDEEAGSPRSRHRLRGDDRVHGARRRAEGESDADARQDRREDLEDHDSAIAPRHFRRAGILIATASLARAD